MAKGFVYLTAVVGWASRKVSAAKTAITLESCHAADVLEEAFKRHGVPEIISTRIRAASLPPMNPPGRWKAAAAGSAWMAVELGRTMFLWNAYGRR